MILTGDEIVRMRNDGRVIIDPFVMAHVGPNSYDLTLSDELLLYNGLTLDMAKDNATTALRIPPEGLVLWPGELYLAATVERCGSGEFVCEVDGRSSVGRLGISVHCTAGRGDLGFACGSDGRDSGVGGRWTLEVSVIKPIRVYAGVRVAQATFFATTGERSRQYHGKYEAQTGPAASRMWKDFAKVMGMCDDNDDAGG